MSAIDYEIPTSRMGEKRTTEPASSIDIEQVRPLPRISVHGFFENEHTQRVLERMMQDRRMSRVNTRITAGGILAAANMFTSTSTPNLLIIETNAEPRNLLDELAPLAEVCDSSTKVIVIGRYNDVMLYRELIKSGISEYLVAPVAMPDLMNAISSIFVDPDAEPLGRTIAFIGAKGGTGSSTIAHNCAFGISTLFSTEVVLADLDLPYGTANIDFDQDPAQGIAEAVFSPERLDEAFLDRILSKCSDHLSLLAAPSLLDRPYDFDRGAFQPVIELLQRSVPITVLDLPHQWSDWTRSVLAEADEVVITAAPDLANLRNTKNLIDSIRKLRPNDKEPHLVLNQVGMPKRPEIAPSDFCEPLETEAVTIIPFDAQLFGAAANSGRMISEIEAKSPTSELFSQLAHVVTGRTTIKKTKKAGLARVLSLLKRG